MENNNNKKFEELLNATTSYYGEALSKLAEGEDTSDTEEDEDENN